MSESGTNDGSVLKRRIPTWMLWCIGAAVCLLDQLTKWAVDAHFQENAGVVILDGVFNLVHRRNSGAAWSMFSGHTWLLGIVSLTALLGLVVFFRKLGGEDWLNRLCLACLGGGIAGNMLDRLFRGNVVDFLDFHWGVHHYPTFNVADSFIVVSTILYAYCIWKQDDPAKNPPPGES